ncbi:MAG TPA: hypothetical protein VFA18_24125 [Gemmataceae bacterium]|nr:hypothetical protein [Gemmataceae bacterium]
MRKWGAWTVKAALVLGLSGGVASAAMADSTDGANQAPPPAGSSSVLSQWLSSTFKKSDSKPAEPDKSVEVKKDEAKSATATSAPAVKDPLAEREHAREDYFRRLKVCDQLQTIADKTGDQTLANEAQELSDRAGKIYEARIARLPVPLSSAALPGAAKKK